jgi:hypothetical protein
VKLLCKILGHKFHERRLEYAGSTSPYGSHGDDYPGEFEWAMRELKACARCGAPNPSGSATAL